MECRRHVPEWGLIPNASAKMKEGDDEGDRSSMGVGGGGGDAVAETVLVVLAAGMVVAALFLVLFILGRGIISFRCTAIGGLVHFRRIN